MPEKGHDTKRLGIRGEPGGNRTPNPQIKSLLLCQLSYRPVETPHSISREQGESGAPDRIRTCGPQLRRLVLYPAELRAREGKEWRARRDSNPRPTDSKSGALSS